jgi:hypothetical protein
MDMRGTGREKDSVSGHAEGCVEATAGEVIAVIFTGDNAYRDYVYRRVMNERTYGATAGDSFWMGYGDYDEVDPFARYREPQESKPFTVPAWRERINKAKRDIEKHKSEQRVQLLAETITDETIFSEIEVIRKWARSLRQPTQSQTGSRELTQAETN